MDDKVKYWAERVSMDATDVALLFLHGRYDEALKAMRTLNNSVGNFKIHKLRKDAADATVPRQGLAGTERETERDD